MTNLRFTRMTTGQHDGYVSADGRIEITDNGGGFGSSRGSGRWAVTIDGHWLANIDTLAAAKRRATDELDALTVIAADEPMADEAPVETPAVERIAAGMPVRDLRIGDTIERTVLPFTVRSIERATGGWNGNEPLIIVKDGTGDVIQYLAGQNVSRPVTRPIERVPVLYRGRPGWLKTGVTAGGMVRLIADDETATTLTADPADVAPVAQTFDVVVCGPNLRDQSKGSFHVHAAGCADLTRGASREPEYLNGMPMAASSRLDVAADVYADMIESDDEAADYVSDFHFFPCCDGLPAA